MNLPYVAWTMVVPDTSRLLASVTRASMRTE
jgi:hypothetical protein